MYVAPRVHGAAGGASRPWCASSGFGFAQLHRRRRPSSSTASAGGGPPSRGSHQPSAWVSGGQNWDGEAGRSGPLLMIRPRAGLVSGMHSTTYSAHASDSDMAEAFFGVKIEKRVESIK